MDMKKTYIAAVITIAVAIALVYPVFAQTVSANKYWRTQRVIIHATGTAVTADMSDYHFVKIHGRLVKIVPITTAEQIKSGSIQCSARECSDQYGTEKVVGVMQFGTEPYKVVGSLGGDVFEGQIYTPNYNLRCAAGGICNATLVGTIKYTISENYEGFGHAAVGEIKFTSGEYADKDYISVVKGVRRAADVTISDSS